MVKNYVRQPIGSKIPKYKDIWNQKFSLTRTIYHNSMPNKIYVQDAAITSFYCANNILFFNNPDIIGYSEIYFYLHQG